MKGLNINQLKKMKDDLASLDEEVSTRNAQIVQKRADMNNAQTDKAKKDDGIG